MKILELLGLLPQKALAISTTDLPGWGIFSKSTKPQTIIVNVINYILLLVGAIAVIYLVYGGIAYLTSGGNEDRVKAAKNVILTAIIGLVIIAVALVIIKVAYTALGL